MNLTRLRLENLRRIAEPTLCISGNIAASLSNRCDCPGIGRRRISAECA